MNTPRILTIMGSGETTPTMVSTHRSLVARLAQPVRAVVLDTPYGFQENAPELAARAVGYFKTSVNIDIDVAGLVRLHDTHEVADPVAIERGLRMLEDADYVFAGPGSPTYALRHWDGTAVPRVLRDKIEHGGIITFASAAALTLGRATVPVYEIYKVGQDVRRLDGLDIMSVVGVNATVIPHFDNAEGGNHDTRYCYLGAKRLEMFERLLDEGTFVLGVDEHTGLIIDLDAGSASVVGNGTVTIRLPHSSRVIRSGETIDLAVLQDPWGALDGGSTPSARPGAPSTGTAPDGTTDHGGPDSRDGHGAHGGATFEEILERLTTDFATAMESRNSDAAVRACLDLEQALVDWSHDSLQGDITDRARGSLRSMISRLGDASRGGLRDPREVVGPYVEAMLTIRAAVRAEKRYDLSDQIRDAFVAIGVEVRDTADGVVWELIDPSRT